MKKTYITTMPDHIGAFLKASELFAELGINITRVSYNKAVDSHTLFIDAEGDEAQLLKADRKLDEIGYINNPREDKSIALLEFTLSDRPGSVTEVLRLIDRFNLNISYISSQENGTDYQAFKMGLFVDSESTLSEFISEAGNLCPVRILDYNHSENVYDNSIFYQTFVTELVQCLGLPETAQEELLVNTNLVMQILDENGTSPYRTFESISRFAHLLAESRFGAFAPRITRHVITDATELILIEPACGSNTMILKSGGEVLFIDSGYALYREEMLRIINDILPDFGSMKKRIFVTHADVDHCGLLPLFDEIIASPATGECLMRESLGKDGYREQNPMHKPYVRICKTLTSYCPPDPSRIVTPWDAPEDQSEALAPIGFFRFGDMNFEVYQGKGGHLKGETVLIDYGRCVVFTGDIYIDTHGLTHEQAEYNQYAPVLMTSVDTDPALCAEERKAILQRLGPGDWQIFGSHGMRKRYGIKTVE